MNIAFFSGGLTGGCPFYRVYQIQKAIARAYDTKEHEAFVFDKGHSIKAQQEAKNNADVLIFQSNFSPDIRRYAETLPVVMELDDLMWDIPFLQEQYKNWGTDEVGLTKADGSNKWIWKDGVDGFNSQANLKKVESLEKNLAAVDMVTTTTEALAAEYRFFNKNVVVLNNCIDFSLWPKMQRMTGLDDIRILWQGGSSHYWDMFLIRNVFKRISDKYPQVKWVFNGKVWPRFLEGVPKDRWEEHEWINITGHSWRTVGMGADIGIAPLKDTRFNRGKSAIKWMEYSAMSIPTVASNTVVYPEEIVDGVTGYLANDENHWVELLSELIEDKQKRQIIGANAYDDVYQRHNLDTNIHKWVETYESVIGAYV